MNFLCQDGLCVTLPSTLNSHTYFTPLQAKSRTGAVWALKADGTVPTSVSELARNPLLVRLKYSNRQKTIVIHHCGINQQ